MWLFFIFVAVPIIEIALFISVGGAIGLWPTLAIVVLTAMIGTQLMRRQGIMTLNRLQTSLAAYFASTLFGVRDFSPFARQMAVLCRDNPAH